jgi:hypothetical protein
VKGKLSAAAVLAGGAAALAAYRARKPKPLGVNYSDAPTKVLIVGGGFGGLAATRELVRAFGGEREVGLGLLDRVNYTTFWPIVPSAISGDIEVGHAASSIRRIIKPFGEGSRPCVNGTVCRGFVKSRWRWAIHARNRIFT